MRVIVRKLNNLLDEKDLSFITREDSMTYMKNICKETEVFKRNKMVNEMTEPDATPKASVNNTYGFAKELSDIPQDMIKILENML